MVKSGDIPDGEAGEPWYRCKSSPLLHTKYWLKVPISGTSVREVEAEALFIVFVLPAVEFLG